MISWYFQNYFLENKDLLFYVCIGILLLIILLTIYFVKKELKDDHKLISKSNDYMFSINISY